MKKLFFLLWIWPAISLAQTDSTSVKTQQIYCKLQLGNKGFANTIVKADFGKKSGNLHALEKEFNRLNENLATMDNEIDGVNYMVSQGWEVVSFTEHSFVFAYLLRKKY